MSRQLRSAVDALGPGGPQLLERKVLEGSHPALQWTTLLEPLAAVDRQVDEVRSRATKRAVALGIVGGLLLVGAVVLLAAAPIAAAVVGAVLLVDVVLFVLVMRTRSYAKRLDLHNGPLELVRTLLPVLGQDAARGAPVWLRLDLRPPARPDNSQGGPRPPYRRGIYHKIVDEWFWHPWCHVAVRFVDDAEVQVRVSDHVLRQRKTKRNLRGKVKTKTKFKRRTTVAVEVQFPPKNYAAAQRPLGPPRPVRKQKVSTGKGTTVRLTRTLKSSQLEEPVPVGQVLDLVAAAYERVHPARRKKLAG